MIQIIGYTALSLNLISMSMKNVLHLRIFSLMANGIYVIYGLMIDAPPVYVGCAIAIIFHSYRIYEARVKKREQRKEHNF